MKVSQNKKILRYLQSGKSINRDVAHRLFSCTRLAARICELKGDGHSIISYREQQPDGVWFMAYALGATV
jgi:hypothetical protein